MLEFPRVCEEREGRSLHRDHLASVRLVTDATGEESERDIPFMKGYTVFNAEQVDGLPEQYRVQPQADLAGLVRAAESLPDR